VYVHDVHAMCMSVQCVLSWLLQSSFSSRHHNPEMRHAQLELGQEDPEAVVHFLTLAEDAERARYYEVLEEERRRVEARARKEHEDAEERTRQAREKEQNQVPGARSDAT
jgi:hypothetical protein